MKHASDLAIEQEAARLNADANAALRIIRAVFVQLSSLNDIGWNNYRDQLAKQIRDEEKQVERTDDTLSRRERIMFYTVWRMAQFLTKSAPLPHVRDYLSTRKSLYTTAALVLNYRNRIEAAFTNAKADPEALALLDFAALNK